MSDGKKTVLVLSGGGAKGSMQIGIFKYLYEQGFRPDAVYGTSVGNLNAFGYSYLGMEGALKFWGSVKKNTDIFKLNYFGPLRALFGLVFKKLKWRGLYNSNPLRKLVRKGLEEGKTPKVPCYSCVVDLKTGEILYGKGGDKDYEDYIVASASIPVLTDPVGNLVDGGVREQSPLKKAIEEGADKIIVILCNPWRKDPATKEAQGLFSILMRTTDLMAHEIFLNDIEECAWYNEHNINGKRIIELEVYAPEQLVIDSLDFNQEKIQPAIEYGYEQAKKGPVFKSGL